MRHVSHSQPGLRVRFDNPHPVSQLGSIHTGRIDRIHRIQVRFGIPLPPFTPSLTTFHHVAMAMPSRCHSTPVKAASQAQLRPALYPCDPSLTSCFLFMPTPLYPLSDPFIHLSRAFHAIRLATLYRFASFPLYFVTLITAPLHNSDTLDIVKNLRMFGLPLFRSSSIPLPSHSLSSFPALRLLAASHTHTTRK